MNDKDLFGQVETIEIILGRLERRIELLEEKSQKINVKDKCALCGEHHRKYKEEDV